MSVILLPNRFRQQPQYNAPLHPAWLELGLVVACNPAVGAINQVEEYKRLVVTNVGDMTTAPTQTGNSWQGGTGKYIDFGAGYGNSTGVTAIQVVSQTGQIGSQPFSSSSGGGNNGIEILIGAASIPGDVIARIASPYVETPALSGYADGKDHTFAVRWRPSTELAIWGDSINNKKSSVNNIASSFVATQNLRLHRRGSTSFTGTSGLFLYFDRPLSDSLLAQLLENPYVVYQARPRKLWASPATSESLTPAAAASTSEAATPTLLAGGLDLTPATAESISVATTPTLSTAGNSIQPQVAESVSVASTPTLTSAAVALAPSAAESTSVAATPVLQNGSSLTVTPAGSTSIASVPVLGAGAVNLAPDTPASLSEVVTPTLTAGGVNLTPSAAQSTTFAATPLLSSGSVLNMVPAVSVSVAVTPTLTTGNVGLTPAECASTSVAAIPVFTSQVNLVVAAAGSTSEASAALLFNSGAGRSAVRSYTAIVENRSYSVPSESRNYTIPV